LFDVTNAFDSEACTVTILVIKHFQSSLQLKTIAVYMITIHGNLAKKSSIENCVNIGYLVITRYN